MNLNVKLDGEEEQGLQYVNRFAINIPPGAINLNIVNPGLANQSYILNPMNPVGQNIVAYQPSMALQSYIALPTEAEGNIIHSLPVGVPVPVGLPVPTGLLQNNFVNTSIIIGDEDCNTPGVIKTASDNLNPENEIKINYIEEPLEEVEEEVEEVEEEEEEEVLPSVVRTCSKANGIEVQSIGVNCSPQMIAEASGKKPCPLEMSIKAANIDIEFEKCEPEVPILLDNCQGMVGKQPLLVETVPMAGELKDDIIKVPFEVPVIQSPIVDAAKSDCKKIKTEITWENNNKQELLDNGFQESLICEVEEEDEDEEDEEVEEEEEEEEEDEEEEWEEEEEEEEEEEKGKEVNNTNCVKGVNPGEGLSSSEESDSLPLSVALKLNKLPNSKSSHRKRGKRVRNETSVSSEGLTREEKTRKKKCQRNKKQTDEEEGGDEEEEEAGDAEEDEDWVKSEDDVLNLKRIKNEFNYKCFYEPNPAKSTTSLLLKMDDGLKKFVRVRSCCSKRECGKKISVQDQKSAHRNFNDLESAVKRDAYLMNCVEHVQKARSTDNAKDKRDEKLLEKTKIQLEIENESNGNQKLSDEIQKAINESLKDCEAAHEEGSKRNEGKPAECEEGNERKNSWNFYIVIDRCRKKVCLQFLLKLFQIPKSRIKNLQKKILSGAPLSEDSPRGNQKSSDVWEVAKSHLDGLDGLECTDCGANPRHRFLREQRTREDLFESFKDFYCSKLGKAPNVKYASYKRFLDKKTSLSFFSSQEGICAECEELKNKKKKQSKNEKGLNKGKKTRESKKQWVVKTDSEENSSDDEPLLKRKKLKLTIPLKAAAGGKAQQGGRKRSSKKYSVENKSKGKSKQSGSRGRDVWSLMLLHLETMPFKECKSCVSKKRHRFLDPSFTTQGLFEDYRKYFLKETNSELGLGFTMYEKYFNRNCNYTICDVDANAPHCPRCALDGTKS